MTVETILHQFLSAPRAIKRGVSVGYDVVAITTAFYLAYVLRIGQAGLHVDGPLLMCLGATLVVSILVFIRMGLYRAILRYINQQAIFTIVNGVLISSLAMSLSGFFVGAFMPRSVPIIYIFTALILIGLPRLIFKSLVQIVTPKGHIKVIVYGASETGNNLVSQLQISGEFRPVAFVDDNKVKQGTVSRGLKVYSPNKLPILIKNYGVTRVLLALGNISREERVRIIRLLEPLKVQVQTIPPITDIVRGIANIRELRNIEIEDVLGREPVAPDSILMSKNTASQVIMVTGAGGSIGSELCRQLILYSPRKLILFDQNEFNLYKIEKEISALKVEHNIETEVVPFLGSVRNTDLLRAIMSQFSIHILYHAAAYKHVPLVEQNIIEAVKNNLLGTKYVAECARQHNVSHFVLISTDKAVRPTNIMGATKRLAEMIVQDLATSESKTVYSMVRFGNVLDSSGSVVPLFREQIAKGGPITVTHKDIVRYFMTLKEAAQLVIQAGALAKGGDVFVLDMGEPVKIVDLARDMALLSGFNIKDEKNPNGDIEIKFTGLRPGEKLYEELLIGDNCAGTEHPRILRANENKMASEDLRELMKSVEIFCQQYRCAELFSLIIDADIEYNPIYELNDLLHAEQRESAKIYTLPTSSDALKKVD